jgi:hypothetical protein
MRTTVLKSVHTFAAVFASLHGAVYAQRADIVEFYNTTLNHYFITSDAAEAAMIERGGAGPGWSRTPGSFAISRGATSAASVNPVCRFYALGPNSHFFTANAGECDTLKALEQSQKAALPSGKTYTGWVYEGVSFYAQTPNAITGACEGGTTPVYRFYNNRFAQNDSNHRFVVEGHARAEMANKGWIDEGVAFCGERALAAGDYSPTATECGADANPSKTRRYVRTLEDVLTGAVNRVELTLSKGQERVFNNQNVLAVEVRSRAASPDEVETFYYDPSDPSMPMVGKNFIVPADFSDTVYFGPRALFPVRWNSGQQVSIEYEGRGRFMDFVKPVDSLTYTTTVSASREFVGQEPVVTAAGTFNNACKFKATSSERSADGGEEYDLTGFVWIAPGAGEVRSEYEFTNIAPNGSKTKFRQTRELIEIVN